MMGKWEKKSECRFFPAKVRRRDGAERRMKTASRCWCIHTHPVTVNTKRNFYTRSNLLFLSLFLICIFGLLSFRSYTPAVCIIYIHTHYGWIQIELLSTWENRLTNSRVTRAHNKLKKNISSVVLPLFFFFSLLFSRRKWILLSVDNV